MGFSFQIAGELDQEPLRLFSQRLFIETYSAQNTPENRALYCREAFSAEHFGRDFQRDEVRYLIARAGEDLAAYTKLVLNQPLPGSSYPNGVEIARFYLDGPFQGQGLGKEFTK